jgi:mono/diheme cytochrome c family protein
MITRGILFLCLFLCSGCFNESEPEILGCGVIDNSPTEVLTVETPDIFKARCAVCHHFNKDLTGPKLEGILDRVPSEEWLRNYIMNEDSLIEAKDEYALKIARWSHVRGIHNHSDLSKQDLDTLIRYITQ